MATAGQPEAAAGKAARSEGAVAGQGGIAGRRHR